MKKTANVITGVGNAGMADPSLGYYPPQGQQPGNNPSFIPSDNKEGDQQNAFESAFNDMAYGVFSSKFPELVDSVVTFKVIESDIDKGLAIGAFILKYRTEDIYVPVVLFEDNIKPMELMYSKRLDKFIPLKQEWLDAVISSNTSSMGEAVSIPGGLPADIDIRKLVSPPIAGRFGYAEDKNISFLDMLKQAPQEVRTKFAEFLAKEKHLLKFAFENFNKQELYNALIEKKSDLGTFKSGLTDLIAVENSTPSETVKEVFGDKAPEAMRLIAREGFAIHDPRNEHTRPYAIETWLKLEKPTQPGVYALYMSDGSVKNSYIFPENQPRDINGGGFGEDYHAHGDCHGLAILEDGSFYRHFGVTTPITYDQLDGKLRKVMDGEGETPKVGNTILFIKHDNEGTKFHGPIKVDKVVTEKNGTKQFVELDRYSHGKEEAKPIKTVVYKETKVKKILGPKNNRNLPSYVGQHEIHIVPMSYKIIVLGEEKECSDLLKREKDVLQFVQDKLIDAGAEKVKVAHVGSNEFSVNGSSVSFDKKDTVMKLAKDFGIKASTALEKVNSLTVVGDKTEFYVVNKQSQEKLGSIFQGGMSAQQMIPSQAAEMQQQVEAPMQQPMQGQEQQMQMQQGLQGQQGVQPYSSELMNDALALRNPELFDIGAIGALASTTSVKDLIVTYIPHLEKALDSIGRVMLTLWMQGNSVKDELGSLSYSQVEDKLRNIFRNLGELILKLGKNSLILKEEK